LLKHRLVTTALCFTHRCSQLSAAALAISLLECLKCAPNVIGEAVPFSRCFREFRRNVKSSSQQRS
jgi:hypothetical protein